MSNTTSPDSNGTKRYFVNYNQDSTSLVVGSKNGYRIYSLNNIDDDLELIYSNKHDDTYLVERLFSSSLVATVSSGSARKLKVCHFKKGTEICNYSYSNSILSVRMNRSRLVVCLQESLYIHNIRDMKVLHTIRDTPPNPTGLCALTITHDNCLLAYPGSATMGEVQIFDAHHLRAKTMIPAHDSPLAALAFTSTGSRIATASEKGTVIRVFATNDGQKLFEFRRGVKRCVDISSLAFSMCGTLLGCSSNTETVHIFKFEEPKESTSKTMDESTWVGYFSSYLPSQVTDVFMQGRAFATAYLPKTSTRNVTALVSIQNQMRLLVATEDAKLYVYNLDTNTGGDLVLHKTYELSDGELTSVDREDGGANAQTEPKNIEGGILGSYAGIVKGNPMGQMSGTESDKMREMVAATESPPRGGLLLNDEQEYPPLSQNSE